MTAENHKPGLLLSVDLPLKTPGWWEHENQRAIITRWNGKERNNSVDTANLLLIDYDKDPFLVLRFWFWVCRQSRKRDHCDERWGPCVCVCEGATLVTCFFFNLNLIDRISLGMVSVNQHLSLYQITLFHSFSLLSTTQVKTPVIKPRILTRVLLLLSPPALHMLHGHESS